MVFLLLVGVLFVYEASLVEAFHQFNDKFYFAKLQFKWAAFGIVTFFLTSLINPDVLKKIALPAFIISIVLLVLVLIPGIGSTVKGATRWLDLGFFKFQPSELIKLTLIIYFSSLFEHQVKLAPLIFSWVIITALIMLQPDLGTAIIISLTVFGLYFSAGGSLLYLLSAGVVGGMSGIGLILSSDYRRQRLVTFLNPEQDPLGASYHIRQIIIGLGSGGLLGSGFGRSLQKYRYLPEATTDSIFAVIAEETGFIGTVVIVFAFLFIALKGIQIASRLDDKFMSLMAIGATLLITLQAFLNLSAMAALVPLTGITLPLISYGGSSLLITLAAAGLLLNLSRYTKI